MKGKGRAFVMISTFLSTFLIASTTVQVNPIWAIEDFFGNAKKIEKIKKEAEKKALQKEYVKTLRFVVEEYQRMAEEEDLLSKKKEQKKREENQVKQVKEEKEKERYAVQAKKGDSWLNVLTTCNYQVQFHVVSEKNKSKLTLDEDVKVKNCEDALNLFKKKIGKEDEILIWEGENGKLIVTDFYGEVYAAGPFAKRLKKKIGELLESDKAKAVIHVDGRVEVWDNKKGHEKVEKFLKNLYENEFASYDYEIEFKTSREKTKYSGRLYLGIEEPLGIEGRIKILGKEYSADGNKVVVRVFHLNGVNKVLFLGEKGENVEFEEGNVKVKLSMKKRESDYAIRVNKEPLIESR